LGITEGIVVTAVFPDSPAERAGLRPFRSIASSGDVITAVDGVIVTDVEEMVGLFNSARPGDTTTLTIFRDGQSLEITATLAEWPDT
jgi:serine protease Do